MATADLSCARGGEVTVDGHSTGKGLANFLVRRISRFLYQGAIQDPPEQIVIRDLLGDTFAGTKAIEQLSSKVRLAIYVLH